ncbi:tRNA pseudouridine(38-40) synthase TruA [Salibacterium halotolerans]|uniref:tRNA pseudouridine synthase A n=1 Tax=Salibacterium halotolerans TaxID=1884432 RepID=A0A1I5WH07_9BACI|nr:tRNA pseudouridine(38-40) synthase TruA [Salibacterium halotolerans]SFQ18909.1 tRNA pseudouridine38-40 synthase [Salibacterium halotolerans]
MQRVKAVICYDGTHFSGWQVQPGKRTVQQEMERALTRIHKGEHTPVVSSGRTDSSVHALGQVIHFDTTLAVPEDRWPKALNQLLAPDVQVMETSFVDSSFHARFDAVEKTYRYRVHLTKERDIFRRHYVYFYPYPVRVEDMKQAAPYLTGTHDFSSFCSSRTDVTDMVRTVHEITVEEDGDELHFTFRGSGFLYNMVRIMAGTLLEVGKGLRRPEDMPAVVEAKNRESAGNTAPGHALYLVEVRYE